MVLIRDDLGPVSDGTRERGLFLLAVAAATGVAGVLTKAISALRSIAAGKVVLSE
jgi:hypothetical protein